MYTIAVFSGYLCTFETSIVNCKYEIDNRYEKILLFATDVLVLCRFVR